MFSGARGRLRVTVLAALGGAVVLAGLALWSLAARPPSPEDRRARAEALLSGVHVSATPGASSLVATSAVADFGVDRGTRLVRVRILDGLGLEVTITSDQQLVFAGPLRVCLVGPYSAPDDAGLSDPCWGDPDLAALVAARLPTDGSGHPMLEAGHPIVVDASLSRGRERCDYPAGEWRLEIAGEPLVGGSAVDPLDLPDVVLELPWREDAPLPLLPIGQVRYCGLATAVYEQQGEPAVASSP